MTATDELMESSTQVLRRMLDERGVEHFDGCENTLWGYEQTSESTGIYRYSADEISGGFVNVWLHHCTPEQAIAATLGTRTLTAEQVMAIAGRHQPDYCSDTHVCFDWQAIADELNATLGDVPRLPHFWTHDGVLHIELPKLPESISVRLPDQRDREVRSARTWQYTRDSGTCHITDNGPWGYPYVCSACGASFDPDVNGGEFNYCPNCRRRIEVDDG